MINKKLLYDKNSEGNNEPTGSKMNIFCIFLGSLEVWFNILGWYL